MNHVVISADRVYLRRFKPSDYLDLHEYLSDPKVVRFEPYEVFTLKQSKNEAVSRSQNAAYWAVCLRDTDKVIGNLYFCEQEYNTFEIGYVFNPAYQKHGFAIESCRALFAYAFEHMNARRIIAYCSVENTSSWKLMERLNMRREGYFLQNVTFKFDADGNPIYFDSYEYAILKSEYDTMQATLQQNK